VAWKRAQVAVMVCGRGVLRLGDDGHDVEALGCSVVEEGGGRGGRNGWHSAAKLGLSAAPIMEERDWGGGAWLVAAQREGWWGLGSATRGAAVEEGPGRRPRPVHSGHGQCTVAYAVSIGMRERERADLWARCEIY
jgi:hypothetical protein